MISTVYIAKNVYGGDGLGRLGDGRVVFVQGACAGENIKAEIIEEKRNFVRARLVEIVEGTEDRLPESDQTPSVPGMVYAHVKYAAERRYKEEQLSDFLERARIQAPTPVYLPPCGQGEMSLHYRNKAVYHFEKAADKSWRLGYRMEPSHQVVDMTEDPLVRPEIVAALPQIRKQLLTLLTQGPQIVREETARKANVTIRWSEKSGVKWWIGEAPRDVVLKEKTAGRTFEVPAGGFYQVNPFAGEALVRAVAAEYRRDIVSAPDVLDLYCGVGVFALTLHGEVLSAGVKANVVGVESGREAVAFAKRNATAQKADAVRFYAEEVGRNLRRLRVTPRTTIVVDPPRGGLEKGVAEFLARSGAARIFYVSCDPATLTRDLRVLTSRYDVDRLFWADMFPRTARFETFVSLRLRKGKEG